MPETVQKPDVNGRVIVWVGAALVATILFAALAAWLLWHAWNPSRPDDGPNSPLDFKVEQPQLESAPRAALRAYLADKEQKLNSWGWIDKENGIAHIPIEQAMQMAVQQDTASQTGKEGKR